MGGCPFHSSDADADDADDRRPDRRTAGRRGTIDRREFVKSALLIGGASSVASLGSVAGISPTVRAAEAEPISPAARLNRQHAWDAFEGPRNDAGNTAPPPRSLFLMLDYLEDGEPSPGHRRQVADALGEIERHFAWNADGVLFTMAYSAGYFDRFDADPPPGASPDDGATVAETVEDLTDLADTNDDVTPDTYDAVLLLASRNGANLLAVEAALWGDDEDLDVSFDATFEGVFGKPDEWPDRRVGFAGPEFQSREETYEETFFDGEDVIPDEAPLSMGFVAGFGESIPREDAVTLTHDQRFPGPDIDSGDVPDLPYVGEVGPRDPGVFAQGTLKHLSFLEIDLPQWYGEDGNGKRNGDGNGKRNGDGNAGRDEDGDDQRRHQMYSPYHTESETNDMGGDRPGSGLEADEDGPDDGPGLDEDDEGDGDEPGGPRHSDLSVREYADRTPETAAGADNDAETRAPTVGHSQKTARARYDVDGDGEVEQPVLRRDWDSLTPIGPDGTDRAGYHFNVPMRFDESIYTLLDATYNVEFASLDGEVDHRDAAVDSETIKARNGIAPYMTATRRGNWLVPPITVRALPYPRAAEAALSVTAEDGTYVVEVTGIDRAGGPIDPATVRFGAVERVNRAGGVEPTSVSRRGGTTTFAFPADGTELGDGDEAKLFGKKRGTREPIVGTATVP